MIVYNKSNQPKDKDRLLVVEKTQLLVNIQIKDLQSNFQNW